MIIGKFIFQAKNVMVGTAVLSARAMNVIYSAKWRGKTSFKRLLRMKGEENGLLFLNVGLEPDSPQNKRKFNAIKKELKKHGIMYAVMPDLCGGDGNTQICVSAKDAKKVEAMLHSHMNGRYKNVYIAEISEFDYTMTGRKADGQPTPQMQALIDSAAKTRPVRGKQRTPDASQRSSSDKVIQIPRKNAAQVITAHDLTHSMGSSSYTWMKSKPLLSEVIDGKIYHLMTMPDGKSGIVVPDKDFRAPTYGYGGASSGETYGAMVCEHKTYYSVNYKNGKVSQITGEQAVRNARKTPVAEYVSRLERVLNNQKKKAMLGEKVAQTAKMKKI